MKNILIVYNRIGIGGSTTSLLSILNNLDYKKYNVDLLLAENEGELLHMLPKSVNLLPQAYPKPNILTLRKRCSIISITKKIIANILSYNKVNKKNIIGQIMTYENARFSRKIKNEYDVAIGFLETFPLNYVSKYVNAKNKIAWIHVDYIGAGFISKFDYKCYSQFNKFVLVSDECVNSFNKAFPQYSKKSIMIENILLSDTINRMAKSQINFSVDKNYINLVTVCRITFAHKGLDRVINAFNRMKKNNINHNFKWYIIGDGIDYDLLKQMIYDNELENVIILLGKKTNPFPYVKQMDAFLLPSRYEGKPMAVTEAQMLGIPPIVTEYASAKEQIKNNYDGIIIENNEISIYDILIKINNNNFLQKLKNNLLKNNYDNILEIEKIEAIIDGDKHE